jgi:hypothetical protein
MDVFRNNLPSFCLIQGKPLERSEKTSRVKNRQENAGAGSDLPSVGRRHQGWDSARAQTPGDGL